MSAFSGLYLLAPGTHFFLLAFSPTGHGVQVVDPRLRAILLPLHFLHTFPLVLKKPFLHFLQTILPLFFFFGYSPGSQDAGVGAGVGSSRSLVGSGVGLGVGSGPESPVSEDVRRAQ